MNGMFGIDCSSPSATGHCVDANVGFHPTLYCWSPSETKTYVSAIAKDRRSSSRTQYEDRSPRRRLRHAWAAIVSCGGQSVAGDPDYGDDSPLYGDDSPLYGDDSPLYGDDSPLYGDDSPLYGAMGFVRKSEKKSGLTRKKKTP